MGDIFISYARKDRPKAQILAEALEQQHVSVWWDRNIPPGKSFDKVIEEALQSARCVIVLWSRASIESDWVKNEAAEGAQRGILVPVLIEDVKIPLEFRRIQTADLSRWDGTPSHPEFDILLEAVSTILGSTFEMKAVMSEGDRRDVKRHKPIKKKIGILSAAVIVIAALIIVLSHFIGKWQKPTPSGPGQIRQQTGTGETRQPSRPAAIKPNVVASKECFPYDPYKLEIKDRGAKGWWLIGGKNVILILDNESDAKKARALARRYTKLCLIGRGNRRANRKDYLVKYLEGDSNIRTDVDIGIEQCYSYNPQNLKIEDMRDKGWQLTDGKLLKLMLDNKGDAEKALALARRYTKLCSIGQKNRKGYIIYWK